jgi:topoisomerase-4 subunit A
VDLKEKGGSTLGGVNIWWDDMTGRLNGDEKGMFLGEFQEDDKIVIIYKDGSYEINNYELINRFEPSEVYHIQKFYPDIPLQVIYLDGKSKNHMVKRFLIETSTIGKKFIFISEEKGSKLEVCTLAISAEVELTTANKRNEKTVDTVELDSFIDIKGWRALGNRLHSDSVKKILLKSNKEGSPIVEAVTEAPKDQNKDSEKSSNSSANNTDEKPPVNPESEIKRRGDSPQLDLL